MEQTKYVLAESELPRRWYNIRADMPSPPQPVLHPGTGEPIGPDDLAPLFPMELIMQEVSEEPEIAIPEEILDIYTLWRPTPSPPMGWRRSSRPKPGSASAGTASARTRS